MSYMSIYKEVMQNKSGNLFLSLPLLFQDMIRTHSYFNDFMDFNKLQRPMLRVIGGSLYSLEDIYTGLLFLYERGIKSFILLENSTHTLNLLISILEINKSSSPFSISIKENYVTSVRNRWGNTIAINGVIITLTGRKKVLTSKSLPADVII